MTNDALPQSVEERRRIAQTARRNLHSERTLILTAGFALTMIVLFFFGTQTFLPIAAALEVRPLLVWVVLSAVISAVAAWLHGRIAGPRIARARELNARLLYEKEGGRESRSI